MNLPRFLVNMPSSALCGSLPITIATTALLCIVLPWSRRWLGITEPPSGKSPDEFREASTYISSI
jgi:hypothetical protein